MKNDFSTYDLILFFNGIYFIGDIDKKGTDDEKVEYFFKDAYGNFESSFFKSEDFDTNWTITPTHHKLKIGDVFVSKKNGRTEIEVKDIVKVSGDDERYIIYTQEFGGNTNQYDLVEETFVKKLVDDDYVYERNVNKNATTTTSSTLNDVEEIERELRLYDIISFSHKMYYISGFIGRGAMDNYQVKYRQENDGVIEEGTFFIDDIDTYWVAKPDFYEVSKGDVFSNAEGDRVTINEVAKRVRTQKPANIQTWVKYTLQKDGKSEDSESRITDILNYMLLNKYNIEVKASTPSVPNPTEEIDTTPLNLEGDFIGEFVNKNATNLLELEKNNRPLFDVVEMTLNLLSKKFGKGESVGEKVEEVIVNADDLINRVQGKDPNLIGLKEIKVEWNEGAIELKGQVYTTWTDFTNALKPLYDDTIGGYNKVKFKATFDDGKYIIDRVDVGQKDFNPMTMKVGEYIDRPFAYFDNLDEDLDNYQWDEEIVVSESGEGEPTREDIQNEIDALNVALMYEDDEERINEIKERINALNITLTLI